MLRYKQAKEIDAENDRSNNMIDRGHQWVIAVDCHVETVVQ